MSKDKNNKVNKFLSELNDWEFRHLELIVSLVSSIKALNENYMLTRERFCELLKINDSDYENYLKGNYEYTLNDMVSINIAYRLVEKEKAEKLDIIKIAGSDEKKSKS